jgi:hypothetical protein
VWVSIIDALSDVRATADTVSPAAAAAVDKFARALLAPIVARVGWEAAPGEHANTPLLRALVLRWAALAGSEPIVAECLARFDAYAAGKGAIAADLKQVIYNTAAASGGDGRYEAIYKLFKAATMSEEQRRLMTALGRASSPALLSRSLNLILGDEVRTQDAPFLVGAVASNPGPAGRTLTWDFVKSRWADVTRLFGGGNFLWASIVGAATGHFDTKAAADDIAAWFGDASHPAGSAERKVKQSLEAIRSRVWRAAILKAEPRGVAEAVDAILATA